MNEHELIRQLTRSLAANDAVVTGPGDDCAVLDLGVPDRWLLFKTDAVVEGIHFTRQAPPDRVGHKALARGLSDIAAMAGTPCAALITVGLPASDAADSAYVQAMYEGMNELARRHQVAIVGGETTTTPDRLLASVSLLGTVDRARCLCRTGARPGDGIFVTGDLGGSLAGKHLEFEPRLAEARWLAAHFSIRAMIDLSDGLATDLPHLLRASQVGAELLKAAIPISRAARLRARETAGSKPPLQAALTDGEDYELLFTVASEEAVPMLDQWKHQFPGLSLRCIGKITAQPGLTLRDKTGRQSLNAHGYVHFQES